jgi:hypothetical protein
MSDINVKAVIRFGIGLLLAAGIVHALVAGLLAWLERPSTPIRPERYTLTHPPAREIYAEQEKLLNRYEWIDRSSGVVRIPIDRALGLLAEESK